MDQIYEGNAEQDGTDRNGWLIGSFIPHGIRHQDNVEVKYGIHTAGETRNDWAVDEQRTTMCLLVSGDFTMRFRDKTTELRKQGDYVLWGPGVDHNWESVTDSIVVTIRWSEGQR